MSRFISQVEAKRDLPSFLREVIETKERIYVRDRAGEPYMTLTTKLRGRDGPAVQVSPRFFRENFSRCSGLIKDGVVFQFTMKDTKESAFARRHTSYEDPCDPIIVKWQNAVIQAALAQQQKAELATLIERLANMDEHRHGELLDALTKLQHGIARLTIGHRPFEEGQLPDEG